MRSEFAELVRCPSCASDGPFSIDILEEDTHEIVEGTLTCQSCDDELTIRQGCVDLLPKPSAEVQREQEAQALRESLPESTWPEDPTEQREYVLSLPECNPQSMEHAPMIDHAFALLDPAPGTALLDLGSGFSWTTAAFARSGCNAVALDVYAKVLAQTRAFVEAGCYFERVLGDMSRLPFRDEGFDIVFANAAIHHTPDLFETMRQIARVLKPGGRVIFVNEPVVGIYEPRRKAAFGAEEREQGINEGIYTTLEWKRALRNAGLEPKLSIPEAGIVEKARRRRALPMYQRFPRKQLASLLEHRWARTMAARVLGFPALYLHPFNVLITARKPD